MHISTRGVNLIKRYEGFRSQAYKPVPGERYWTIGYGDYGPHVHPGQRISEAEATRRLHKRLEREFVPGVDRLVTTKINQNRFDALVSLAYNIGLGNFASSTVLRETNKRHFLRAAGAFKMWVRGAGGVLPGLVKRRKSERNLYLRPVLRRKKR